MFIIESGNQKWIVRRVFRGIDRILYFCRSESGFQWAVIADPCTEDGDLVYKTPQISGIYGDMEACYRSILRREMY